MNLNYPKKWHESKGILGAIAAILCLLLNAIFNLDISEAEASELLAQSVALIGSFVALYGRYKANRQIE